jgi:hypothetical protein
MSTGNHGWVSSERAIENLISSYAFLNDDADISGLGKLFADAVFTLDETTARGREEIEHRARGIIQVNEDGTSQTRHDITTSSSRLTRRPGRPPRGRAGPFSSPSAAFRSSVSRRALPEPLRTPRQQMALRRT